MPRSRRVWISHSTGAAPVMPVLRAASHLTQECMSCFYHHDRESVGGCKSCGKALCPECAVDLGKGLACRGRCEDDVRTLIGLIDRNIALAPQTARLVESGRRTRSSAAMFNLITGAIFVAWGISDLDRFSFLAILGGCFLAYGIFRLLQARRFAKERQQE